MTSNVREDIEERRLKHENEMEEVRKQHQEEMKILQKTSEEVSLVRFDKGRGETMFDA